MRTPIFAAALTLVAGAASAACEADKPGAELSHAEAAEVYACLAEEMAAGYRSGPKRWIPEAYVDDYRDWRAASTAPAAPGFHGGRFLMTWVNPVGYDDYVEFRAEGAEMPSGTVIAKESFTVGEDGAAAAGPLFIMEKAAEGASPESGDWYYMMVSASGVPQAVDVMTACHECHASFEASDHLGYPVEEVRVAR